ncbi:MAG: hypothetical protein EAZ20_02435 [Bacteroidetes bacterium]|nr:MAG: hypothetical protein EAZ20_02435 [Bacteroidota bacterium]
MKTSFIEYSLNFSSAHTENQPPPFQELEYPDCLSEFACGNVVIFENDEEGKFIYLENIELPAFFFHFAFAIQKLKENTTKVAAVSSIYQTYDLILELDNNTLILTSIVANNEKNITLNFETLEKHLKNMQISLFEDLKIAYSNLVKLPDFLEMEKDFNPFV